MDESALRIARSGTYLLDQLSGLPDNLKDQYFLHRKSLYTIHHKVRSILIFGSQFEFLSLQAERIIYENYL